MRLKSSHSAACLIEPCSPAGCSWPAFADRPQPENQFVGRMLGMVVEDSSIGTIKFEYASKNKISQGKLIEVKIGEQLVLYQVVQGITVEEILAHKNKSGSNLHCISKVFRGD